jgi:aconitate hydratase
VVKAISGADLVAAGVLSGNRNFEGRVHPYVKANYLASPPLVVAYAIAGSMDVDLTTEPLGSGKDGKPVYMHEIWPTAQEINAIIAANVSPQMFKDSYSNVFISNETWNKIRGSQGDLYDWDPDSTYVQEPPFFVGLTSTVPSIRDIKAARVLAFVGDSITTDHISPAGNIPADSPAGKYLIEHGIEVRDFNSYGSRRGNDRIMTRGTFANIRLKNRLVPAVEGGYTVHLPGGDQMSIYDAAMKYRDEGVPLLVLGGKEYGSGSSRDWAAKGTLLLGVKAVVAESFERIHRSNLVGMGVLPLVFKQGENADSLGLTGQEMYNILGLKDDIAPRSLLRVEAVKPDGSVVKFEVVVRLDTHLEVEYYRNGGILHTVLRNMSRG